MRKQHSKHLHAWGGQKSAVTESMTVETTVCLRDQTIGRCRFWFKELTDPNPPLPARWFEGRVKKTMKPESCLWITTGENSMSCHMDKYMFQ